MEGLGYNPEMEFKAGAEAGDLNAELLKIPVVGKELEQGKYQRVTSCDEETGEVYSAEEETGLLPNQKITWDNLVAVRAEWEAPRTADTGDLLVETPFTKTNGEAVRLTSHWTLNHRVREHNESGYEEGKGWGDAPFVIIAPMSRMVENNGKPLNMLSVDTFWDKDIRLPKGTIIINRGDMPGSVVPSSESTITITVQSKKEMEKMTEAVIEKMGYTNIQGGKLGSETTNFDGIVTEYAKSEGIKYTTAHSSDEITTVNTSLERYFSDGNLAEALSLISNLGEIPNSLRDKIFDPIAEAVNSEDFDARIEAYSLIEEIFHEITSPQIKKGLILKMGDSWRRFITEYSDYMETQDVGGKRNTLEFFNQQISQLAPKS